VSPPGIREGRRKSKTQRRGESNTREETKGGEYSTKPKDGGSDDEREEKKNAAEKLTKSHGSSTRNEKGGRWRREEKKKEIIQNEKGGNRDLFHNMVDLWAEETLVRSNGATILSCRKTTSLPGRYKKIATEFRQGKVKNV